MMSYEMAMLMNWLLVAAGLLASDLFSGLFDSDEDSTFDEPIMDLDALTDGDDVFVGTEGNDRILGLAGNDDISGGDGADTLEGNTGDDTLSGGLGGDHIAGGGGTDIISGDAGDDVLSSDRLDSDADWTRGDAETLSGGAGDDILYFSGEDAATGGTGADHFGVIDTGEDPALITDFEIGVDEIVIYVEGLDGAATPPVISYATDTTTDMTTVSLDGVAVVDLNGQFTPENLAVTLADVADIDFGNA